MALQSWILTVFLACVVLWKISTKARYFLKLGLYGVMSFVYATSFIPLMLFRPKDARNALMPAAALRYSSFILGMKQKVQGKENVVQDSGCIVLINHQSVVDLIVLAELWPILKNAAVISKQEIFYFWPFGLAAWLWGTIFINRVKPAEAQDTLNKIGTRIREDQRNVLMFPEGTRSLKEKLMPFKKGAFHLAIASKCPILPVVVDKYKFLGHQRWDKGEINITVLPHIETKGLTKEDIPQLMEQTYKIMNDYYQHSV